MFYTFSEEEYRNILDNHEKKIQELEKKNLELTGQLSLFVNESRPCALSTRLRLKTKGGYLMYCSECSIKDLCMYKHKEWPK